MVKSFQVERANYLLDAFVECAKNGETYEGRLISHLLHNPSEDGGQWDMLTNLIEKYGVIPKVCYPESWSSENSRKIGQLLNNRVKFVFYSFYFSLKVNFEHKFCRCKGFCCFVRL